MERSIPAGALYYSAPSSLERSLRALSQSALSERSDSFIALLSLQSALSERSVGTILTGPFFVSLSYDPPPFVPPSISQFHCSSGNTNWVARGGPSLISLRG